MAWRVVRIWRATEMLSLWCAATNNAMAEKTIAASVTAPTGTRILVVNRELGRETERNTLGPQQVYYFSPSIGREQKNCTVADGHTRDGASWQTAQDHCRF